MLKDRKMTEKILLNYAFTFMMISLADASSMVIDGLITSRNLGATLLAATGLGGTSYQMVSLFCCIFAIGLQATCSGAMGAGDSKKTNRYFTSGIVVLSVIALMVTVVGFLCLDPLCRLFGADGNDRLLYDGLRNYMRGWFIGIPGFMAFSVLCPLATLDGNKRLVTIVTILQSALNIVGDLFSVLFWKNDGIRAIYGVGFSSGIAFDIAAIVLLNNFFRKRSAFRFELRQFRFSAIREMLRIGLPKLTMYVCKMLSPIFINRTVLMVGGACGMAAMSVKSSLTGLFYVVGGGIAESVNLLSQVYYGEKDKKSLKETAGSAAKAIVLFCTALSLILFLLSSLLASLFFSKGTEEYAATVTMLRCFALSLPVNALNSGILSYLQATRKAVFAHLHTASHRFVFSVLCTIVLGRIFGMVGLFIALPVSEVLVLITYIVITQIVGRKKEFLDALLLIPNDFDYDDSLSFSVSTMQEVIGISEKIEAFCLENGIDKDRSVYAALCIEETAGNVVDHGFKKDNKAHNCELRVMIDANDVILRIRDDCRYFNMKERYEVLKSKGKLSGIGIRLVYGIAKDVNYVNILNTNTLIIRI